MRITARDRTHSSTSASPNPPYTSKSRCSSASPPLSSFDDHPVLHNNINLTNKSNSFNESNNSNNANNTTILKRLSKLRSSSANMFRQKWTGSGNTNTSNLPSRNSSVFGSLSSLGSRRSSRSETDAYITLAAPSSSGKDGIVTDDELAEDSPVRPARFNLVPISGGNQANTENEDENRDVPENQDDSAGKQQFTQAGGHNDSFWMDGSTLTKKVTDREATFYEQALEGEWPISLLPKYFGRVGDDAISIENLTHGYSRPCVVDLKMGIHTFENDEKSFLKRMKMSALDQITGSRSDGCRLEGLSMYRTVAKQAVNLKGSKRQTHAMSMDVRINLQDMLTFFLTDEYGVRTDVALRFQTAVERILDQFERHNDKFLFIGSSILLIYDNDNQEPHMRWARALRKIHTVKPGVRLSEDQISGLTRRTLCDVRMIDFAHTGPLPKNELRDEGYIKGLKSILAALKAIRANRQKPIFSFRNAAIDLMEEHRAKSLAATESGQQAPGNVTFGAVLKELTAVCHVNDDTASELSS